MITRKKSDVRAMTYIELLPVLIKAMQEQQDFIDNQLEEFVRYDVNNYAVNGNYSFYDAVMELKLKDGSTMLSEQTVATEWKDGKIYRERYYHV